MTDAWRKLFAHPVYERLFHRVRTRYERLERVGGTVQLTLRDDGEREALGGLLGRDLRYSRTVTVRLAELDDILSNSRVGLKLPEFLERYFEEPLVLSSEQERKRQARWEAFFRTVQKALAREVAGTSSERKRQVAAWIEGLQSGTASGSHLLRRLYNEGEDEALNTLTLVVQALMRLPTDAAAKRIPIFAAEMTGDPHALDAGQPFAKLFQAGLKVVLEQNGVQSTKNEEGSERPVATGLESRSGEDALAVEKESSTAEMEAEGLSDTVENEDDWSRMSASLYRRRLFQRAGLLDDDVSSTVATFGLSVREDTRKIGLSQLSSPLVVLTWRHLEQNWAWDCRRPLYVVENPSVFSAVIDAWDARGTRPAPQLALMSGQPSVAAIRLLEQWTEQGGTFYYNGDFDWKGLEIACRLRRMFPRSFRPWRFDSATYSRYGKVEKPPVPLHHQQALRAIDVPWDGKLPEQIAAGGTLYQEHIVDTLIRDLGLA